MRSPSPGWTGIKDDTELPRLCQSPIKLTSGLALTLRGVIGPLTSVGLELVQGARICLRQYCCGDPCTGGNSNNKHSKEDSLRSGTLGIYTHEGGRNISGIRGFLIISTVKVRVFSVCLDWGRFPVTEVVCYRCFRATSQLFLQLMPSEGDNAQ